jgi:predicted DNA-binding protein
MIRTNFYFPQVMIDRLKAVKERTGIPMSEFIRRAIERALTEAGV